MKEIVLAHLAWLAPIIGSTIALAGLLIKIRTERFYSLITSLSILISALVSTYLATLVLTGGKPILVPGVTLLEDYEISLTMRVDGVSVVIALIASWLSFIISIYSIEYMKEERGYGRFFALLSLFVGGMMLLVLADSLVTMFVGWKITGLCSYALISFWYENPPDKWVGRPGRYRLGFPMFFSPTESGVRALAFTMAGDAWLMTGIAALAYLTGTTSLTELSIGSWMSGLAEAGLLVPILLFIVIGALAKSAQFPFHEWLLTAMTAPTPVSALIHAATMVNAGVYLFLRIVLITIEATAREETLNVLAGELSILYSLVLVISILTSIFTSLIALAADELKVVLAASTSSQLGLMFSSASVGGLLAIEGRLDEAQLACFASLLHLASHAIFKASLFLASGWIIHSSHSRFLDGMRGVLNKSKITTIAYVLASASLAGIPPTLGFFSKDVIFHVLKLESSSLLFVVLFSSAITSLYVGRTLGLLLGKASDQHIDKHHEEGRPLFMITAYSFLAILSLALGTLWPLSSRFMITALVSSQTNGCCIRPHLSLELATLSTALSGTLVLLAAVQSFRGIKVFQKVFSRAIIRKLYEVVYDRFLVSPLIYALVGTLGRSFSLVAGLLHNFVAYPTLTLIICLTEFGRIKISGALVDRSTTKMNRFLNSLYKLHSKSTLLSDREAVCLMFSCVDIHNVHLRLDRTYHSMLVSLARTSSGVLRSLVQRGDSPYLVGAYILSVLAIVIVLLVIVIDL
ncbi:MAG: NADH-quinone oxidoreductase subunit L [Acidilobaceae archaeon]